MIGLTHRQAQAKAFIASRIAADGVAPSLAEIGAELGVTSRGYVTALLATIEQRGHIRRLKGQARAIEIVGEIDNLHRRPTAELTAMRDRIDTILKGRTQ